ncbi:hypothetical protein B0H17DRAFT_1090138 [Mycena rosella]|uniref:DUF1996 domain-containing protein n=1 Tax=Mycena rosella TaxID=1033263 RepID=A0AAD7G4R7_MYCRO|nr:hypothetical protein B0H17DRAFT_1090138 [Mycena rosella]
MARNIMSKLLLAAAVFSSANAYFLFAMNDVITTERLDPIVSPGKVAGHVHSIFGGSNFRAATNTSFLRQSECTSSPIKEDKSNYWFPTLYFQWKNGSFTSVSGNPVMYVPYYLYSGTAGVTTPFPDDFRMLSGTPTLRSYNASSFAQQAVTFLCLDFNGVTTKFNQLPTGSCPSGIRAQINFPSCWDGVNADSADHKSHVAYLSGGPDSGSCSDKNYPVTLPRLFMEAYLDTASLWEQRDQAMNPDQPFVYSMGDPTGYGYHGDFMMGWDQGVLQNVVDKCNCNDFGDPTCCSTAGIFTFTQGGTCRITKGVDETTTGTIATLPGNNPVVPLGGTAVNLVAPVTPALISPVYAYTGDSPSQTGSPVGSPVTVTGGGATTIAAGTSTASSKAGTTTTASATTKTGTTTAGTSTKVGTTTTAGTSTEAGTTTTSGTSTETGTTAPGTSTEAGTTAPGTSTEVGTTAVTATAKTGTAPASQPTSGSGSGSPGSPGKGSGVSSPGKGSNPSSPGKGSSPGSGSNHTGSSTCHKKKPHSDKRAAVRRARSHHDSAHRRFALPEDF